MDSGFTFDDIRSSRPQSIGATAKIAKLTNTLIQLRAEREIIAEIQPSNVGKFDQKISAAERRLRQLTSGEGKARRK